MSNVFHVVRLQVGATGANVIDHHRLKIAGEGGLYETPHVPIAAEPMGQPMLRSPDPKYPHYSAQCERGVAQERVWRLLRFKHPD